MLFESIISVNCGFKVKLQWEGVVRVTRKMHTWGDIFGVRCAHEDGVAVRKGRAARNLVKVSVNYWFKLNYSGRV